MVAKGAAPRGTSHWSAGTPVIGGATMRASERGTSHWSSSDPVDGASATSCQLDEDAVSAPLVHGAARKARAAGIAGRGAPGASELRLDDVPAGSASEARAAGVAGKGAPRASELRLDEVPAGNASMASEAGAAGYGAPSWLVRGTTAALIGSP